MRPAASSRPVLAGILLLTAACSGGGGGGEASPEAAAFGALALARPVEPGGPLLLCGRYEVTQADFAGRAFLSGEADLPAVGMSRPEAEAWAAGRGMRLPTYEEWVHLAGGATGGPPPNYPWGPKFAPWTANTLRLGLHRPLPVGTFTSGMNALSAYDFAGNVWEWIADTPLGAPGAAACGGSFANFENATQVRYEPPTAENLVGPPWSYLDNVRIMSSGDRAEDVGFRCVATAGEWIREQAVPLWGRAGPGDRRAMRLAFGSWASDLRGELADQLEAAGVSESFCQALREGS